MAAVVLGARNEQDYPYFPHERHCVVAASFRDGREAHVDWGQGLMVAGRNPVYWQRRPRFEVLPA
jgi:hypothetical protein